MSAKQNQSGETATEYNLLNNLLWEIFFLQDLIYELGGHFITPSGVSWTPLGAFYELFTFHLAFYIIWWTSGGGYCNFVADHQTNFWRCNLWNYQETANVYQQVLIVKKVNLMIYQPSLSLYIFLVLYDLVVRFIKFWKSKITLWMKQSFKMNKPTCQWCCLQGNSCPPQSPEKDYYYYHSIIHLLSWNITNT